MFPLGVQHLTLSASVSRSPQKEKENLPYYNWS
jgi:hypothetical protein